MRFDFQTMSIELKIADFALKGIQHLYGLQADPAQISVQKTRKDQSGDFTLVVFPLLRYSRRSPEETGHSLGEYLISRMPEIGKYEVVKGFLNLVMNDSWWTGFFAEIQHNENYGHVTLTSDAPHILVEFSSPNTNKPLHLGHIRNNLLGHSVSQILKAAGHRVTMVNLVNDRGIHICKSMLSWQKWGEGITPEKAHVKGDRLVGDFYVRFDLEYKKQVTKLIEQGIDEEQAAAQAPLLLEAQQMLRKWEEHDPEVLRLWEMMNEWVCRGFEETYRNLGIKFDKIYYESQTYKLGKQLVSDALEKGILYQEEDGSVWADLTDEGLDQKLLLRADGTSVYMTQDLGTAHQRYKEYSFDRHVYVVGNEQNYHFKVLGLILKKMGFPWYNRLYHLSYGMVELPEGKMKSREGKVVDADDLIQEMYYTAKEISERLGKMDTVPEEKRQVNYPRIAMGALKYYILKVDPQKTMLFNPEESIDFNGNTGPFIQYTYVRIRSVERKAKDSGIRLDEIDWSREIKPGEYEKQLIKRIHQYPGVLKEAARAFSPALIANYLYELVKEYNQFYQFETILKEQDKNKRNFRLRLSSFVARHLAEGMNLLGIEMPERM